MGSTLDNEGPLSLCVIGEHVTLIEHPPAIPDPGPDIAPPVNSGLGVHMGPIVSEGLVLISLEHVPYVITSSCCRSLVDIPQGQGNPYLS